MSLESQLEELNKNLTALTAALLKQGGAPVAATTVKKGNLTSDGLTAEEAKDKLIQTLIQKREEAAGKGKATEGKKPEAAATPAVPDDDAVEGDDVVPYAKVRERILAYGAKHGGEKLVEQLQEHFGVDNGKKLAESQWTAAFNHFGNLE